MGVRYCEYFSIAGRKQKKQQSFSLSPQSTANSGATILILSNHRPLISTLISALLLTEVVIMQLSFS